MHYQAILNQIADRVRHFQGRGKVADYIPALARVPADKFGMSLATVDGDCYSVGDAHENFSIQSISKVPSLMLAVGQIGSKLWERVGREPSGDPFNSLVQLEFENGVPRNPMINAGALVVTDCVLSNTRDAKQAILDFVRVFAGDKNIHYDSEVAASEMEHRFGNAALANYMKSRGNLANDVDDVLDVYFHQCSIAMSCRDLARMFLPLANKGVSPIANTRVLSEARTKRVNAVLLTCGLYDAVGNFAFRVGLPAKSGVGGGIVAIMPNEFSVAVWAPELEESGNSLVGTEALALLTTLTGKSIF
jgi:glutaminase